MWRLGLGTFPTFLKSFRAFSYKIILTPFLLFPIVPSTSRSVPFFGVLSRERFHPRSVLHTQIFIVSEDKRIQGRTRGWGVHLMILPKILLKKPLEFLILEVVFLKLLLSFIKDHFLNFFFHFFTNLQSSIINIELIKRFKVTVDIISLMIHNNTLQSFVWSSIALKIHVSHLENWIFLFVVSVQKWLAHFLLQKRWRNEGFKGTSDMSLYKWRVTWNYAIT